MEFTALVSLLDNLLVRDFVGGDLVTWRPEGSVGSVDLVVNGSVFNDVFNVCLRVVDGVVLLYVHFLKRRHFVVFGLGDVVSVGLV
ncbi:hypothetical protein [Methanobrevibacter sp.]